MDGYQSNVAYSEISLTIQSFKISCRSLKGFKFYGGRKSHVRKGKPSIPQPSIALPRTHVIKALQTVTIESAFFF